MLYNSFSGNITPKPTFTTLVRAAMASLIKGLVKGKSGDIAFAAVTITVVSVSFGGTINGNYEVFITPSSSLATTPFYISGKFPTSFDITYTVPVTGNISFDWIVVH